MSFSFAILHTGKLAVALVSVEWIVSRMISRKVCFFAIKFSRSICYSSLVLNCAAKHLTSGFATFTNGERSISISQVFWPAAAAVVAAGHWYVHLFKFVVVAI